MNIKIFHTSFVFLIIGQAISMFGTVLLKFTISLFMLDVTDSAALFGTITAISYLPQVFLSPIAGIVADRHSKRNLMVALDGMYGIMAVILSILMVLQNRLIGVAIIMVMLAVIASFETPVAQAAVPLIQSKDNLVKSNAVVNQINMIANLAGPLLAGIFYGFATKNGVIGIRIIFICCAICFFLAAVLEIFIKIPQVPLQRGTAMQNVKQDLIESIHFLISENVLVFKAIILNAVFVLLIQPLITTGAPYIIRIVLELNSTLNGLSQAVFALAGLAGGILAGILSNRFKISKVYQLFIIMGIAVALFGITVLLHLEVLTTYLLFIIVGVIVFLTASIAGIYILSAIGQRVPKQMMGRIMAFYSAIVTAALPIGIFIYGILYEKFISYLSVIFFVTAGLIILVGILGKNVYKQF